MLYVVASRINNAISDKRIDSMAINEANEISNIDNGPVPASAGDDNKVWVSGANNWSACVYRIHVKILMMLCLLPLQISLRSLVWTPSSTV